MKPSKFEYAAPAGLEEALALLSSGGPDARLLAGGQSLMPAMNLRLAKPSLLVDLRRVVGLRGLRLLDDGSIVAGAMTRHRDFEMSRAPVARQHQAPYTSTNEGAGDRMIRIVFVAAMLAFTQAGWGQNFPHKTVHIINPFPAGGTLDTVVRLIAQKMSDQVGQPVVVENKTGASGIIGFSAAAKAAPDGHTMVAMANSFAVAPAVRNDLPYDSVKDFAPVTFIGSTPHVLAVHASSPANSVKELVALAKQRPQSVSYGTLGEGTYSHLVGKMFEKAAGVELLQVPFRGSAPTLAALVANQITMAFGNLPEIMPHVKAGRLKPLAIASLKRSPLAPELPMVAELGYPGFTSESWYGFLAPSGTPPALVSGLQREVARALAHPDLKERLAGLGVVAGGESPAEFAAFLREQMSAYAAIVKEANIKASAN